MSQSEQQGEKEKKMDAQRLAQLDLELDRLNDEYEKMFGFKFILFKGERSKEEVVPILKERMKRSREVELETGLREMTAIARARLAKLTSSKL